MAATFVYVGNAESQSVTIFSLAVDGALTPVDTKAVPGPAKPGSTTPMAVSPDKRFLTVGLRNERKVEITRGVAEGEDVIATAGTFVSDGDHVTPVRAAAD